MCMKSYKRPMEFTVSEWDLSRLIAEEPDAVIFRDDADGREYVIESGKPEWISAEKVPPTDGEYLVTWSSGFIGLAECKRGLWRGQTTTHIVKAWMLPPAPCEKF